MTCSVNKLCRMAQLCGLLTTLIALIVILGWILDLRILTSFSPKYIPMAPSTALAFMMFGAVVFVHTTWPANRLGSRMAIAANLLISLWGLFVTSQFVIGFDLQLEQVLAGSSKTYGSVPIGRMSPISGLMFVIVGSSLLPLLVSLSRWRFGPDAAASLAAGGVSGGMMIILGYCYQAPMLFGGYVIPVALPTAIAFELLSLGLLASVGIQIRTLRIYIPLAFAICAGILLSGSMLYVLKRAYLAGNYSGHEWNIFITGILFTIVLGAYLFASERHAAEARQALELLQSSEERFRSVAQSATDAIVLADSSGNIVFWNKGAQEIFGYPQEEATGRPLTILMPERFREAHCTGFDRTRRKGESHIMGKAVELTGIRRDGKEFPLEISLATWNAGSGVFYSSIIRDITKRKKLEEEILKTKKLEAIGMLAGGIAHDFNNLLGVIVGNINMAQMDTEPESLSSQLLDIAATAALKAGELTRKFITFSTGGAPLKRKVSIRELIGKPMSLALGDSDFECEYSLAQDLWDVEVDEGQMGQVLYNIVANAREAMHKGGVVRISAGNVQAGSMDIRRDDSLQRENFVKISVSDQGVGISDKHVEKIFDPYFSTKERGAQKGMGLGLATAYAIVRKHEGYIRVESQEGVGTTFHIYLPALENSSQMPMN